MMKEGRMDDASASLQMIRKKTAAIGNTQGEGGRWGKEEKKNKIKNQKNYIVKALLSVFKALGSEWQ